ncbi:MAG: hypothetical protein IJA94_04655 [Bacilli bacterium]|nr:hypothetical protein [Bacilli bacterium]
MKKFVFNIFIIILCLFGLNIVNADSIALKNQKFSGDEVSIDIEITTDSKMAAGIFSVKYDDTKLKDPVGVANIKTWNVDIAKRLMVSGDSEVSGTQIVGTLTFKLDDSFKLGDETTITLEKGQFANNDLIEWDVEGTTITIKRVEATDDNPSGGDNSTTGGDNSATGGENNSGDGNPLYACQKHDGKFYNNSGVEVSKAQYEKECPIPNPDTGFNFPAVMFFGGLLAIAVIFVKNRNSIKLSKI